MKILQVIPYFHPVYGGPVGVVHLLSKKLVEHGHEVTIYTTDASARNPKSKTEDRIVDVDGIKVYYLKDSSYAFARNHHLFFSPGIICLAKREIKNFDLIHLQDYRTFQNIIIHHYARKYNIPYIMQTHGSLPRMVTKQRLKKLYDILWGYRLLKDASKVIALTRVEAKQFENMGVRSDKIEIVPNGIDLAEFSDLPQRGKFRHKYGLDDSQRVIHYLGRIHKIKGLDTLVKAFASLAKKLDDARLVIVGPDDGYLPHLKGLITELGIGDRTLLTGPLYSQEKLEAYVDADVYVLPSVHEIFGITVLEACACGIPVILTENCGMANWVIDGKAGWTIPTGDEEQLSVACLKILTDEGLRKSLGEGGKKLVKEYFSLTKITRQTEDIYSSCMRGK